jgi:hypothetical protein
VEGGGVDSVGLNANATVYRFSAKVGYEGAEIDATGHRDYRVVVFVFFDNVGDKCVGAFFHSDFASFEIVSVGRADFVQAVIHKNRGFCVFVYDVRRQFIPGEFADVDAGDWFAFQHFGDDFGFFDTVFGKSVFLVLTVA